MRDQGEKNVITGKAPLILPDTSYGQYTLEKLRNNPLRIIQVDEQTGRFVTNREILVKSVNLAAVFDERGVKVGDTIAISAENHINWFIAACAILYRGAVIVPMNPEYAEGETLHCLKIAKPKIIFVSRRSEALLSRVKETLPWKMEIIELDDVSLDERIPSLNKMLSESRAWPNPYNYNAVHLEGVDKRAGVILYSSGTTGLPKGVMLSHRNLFLQEFSMLHPDFLNFDQNDVLLTVLPFFHGYGFSLMMDIIHIGATAITMSAFNPNMYLNVIGKYRVTILLAVPPLMNFFAKSPTVPGHDYSSLKTVICAAAPLLPEMRADALKRLGHPNLRMAYGMTELSIISTMSARNTRKPESVGHLVPGISCKVVDTVTSESLGPGRTGELCFKGDQVMLGYKDNRQATIEMIDESGWLRTGDLGYYDQEGDLFVVGRLKELIKYKGFQVSPSEIEDLLLTHDDITDAAVVGKPDEADGELPMAFVVLRPGAKLTTPEIYRFINGRVSPQSQLRGGVHFIKEIPKNPGGKILRRELLRLVAKM